MIVKLFVLGLPGSGKSTISRYIAEQVNGRNKIWSTKRYNDYDILYEMFLADTEGIQFLPVQNDGFDIHDLSVFDTALQTLEKKIQQDMHSTNQNSLVIVEFSRDDYIHALKNFTASFLYGSYLLFLDVALEICMQRILNRATNPITSDDHFVSKYIFNTYYAKDKRQYRSASLREEFGFSEEHIKIIANSGLFKDIVGQINNFIDTIFMQESNTFTNPSANY